MEKLLVVEPEMCLHGAFEVGQRRADSNPLSFSLSQLQNCRVIGRCAIKVGSAVIPQVDGYTVGKAAAKREKAASLYVERFCSRDIAARDDNFYRVVMQAEPLGAARRNAGLERRRNYERADSLADPELVGELSGKLDLLEQMVATQSRSFDYLREQASSLKERSSHIPAIQPVSEKNLRAMASGYGYRRDPIYGTAKFHEGMDFSAPIGTPVYATGDGKVVAADWNSGYGKMIEIDHGYRYRTRYAHLSDMLVRPGQTVRRGDLIGRVGNTGKSTGPHLHYEVRLDGEPQNPVHYYYYDLTPQEYEEMIRQAENAGHVMD